MSAEVPTGNAKSQIAHRKSKRWLWFFAVLVVLTALGAGLDLWFNFAQQLSPERLAEARRLWAEQGPRDYTLEYVINQKGSDLEEGLVHVRNGEASTTSDRLPRTRAYQFESVEALFAYLEKDLEASRQPDSPRTFITATFDRNDGHPIRYVRSVSRTRERVEITVTLRKGSD
jgi:hypothetical protein